MSCVVCMYKLTSKRQTMQQEKQPKTGNAQKTNPSNKQTTTKRYSKLLRKKCDSNNQTSLFQPERNKNIDNNHLFRGCGKRGKLNTAVKVNVNNNSLLKSHYGNIHKNQYCSCSPWIPKSTDAQVLSKEWQLSISTDEEPTDTEG